MPFNGEQLRLLLEKAEERERTARRRAVYYSLIPIVLAGLLLGVTAWQVRNAQQQLAAAKKDLAETTMATQRLKEELKSVNQELEEAQKAVTISKQDLAATKARLEQAERNTARLRQEASKYREQAGELQDQALGLMDELDTISREIGRQQILASKFREFLFTEDPATVVQYLASTYPEQSKLYAEILEFQRSNISWNPRGNSPGEGFDSPGFARYVLQKHHLLPTSRSGARDLRQLLPRRESPRVGDIVFYEGNNVLFYFASGQNTHFVMGMTHLGILAFRTDFERIEGYGEVQYPH